MKNKISLLLILSLASVLSVNADMEITGNPDYVDFTGESFFRTPSQMQQNFDQAPAEPTNSKNSRGTTPPIKQLRLKVQDKIKQHNEMKYELAPTPAEKYEGEVSTSEYASKEIKDEFDETVPDGFEADEEAMIEQSKHRLFSGKKNKVAKEEDNNEDIVLDCETVNYDTNNYLVLAEGNVNIEFVKQKTVVKADKVTFDRMNNTIKAEGNVKIIKHGSVVTGDYIFVDMNEENALIENPVMVANSISIHSQKGYVYGDRLVQEKGSINVDSSYPINFRGATRGPQIRRMLLPKDMTLTEDMEKGLIKFEAKDIKINQKSEHEIISIKKGKLSKGGKTVFKIPAIKIYTNKNHDYGETNFWEVGSYRGMGVYTGPGWVFELPKGSVLKAMPILNYKSGFGIGALGRFSSGTNQTFGGYGTAASKFMVYGQQKLDDDLFLHYGVNSYMDEWFLGRRRPKYGVGLVYNKSYSSNNFLLKDRPSAFAHRLEAGYFQNLDFDNHFEKIRDNGHIGTTRFRYMAQVNQDFFNYLNKEKQTAFSLGLAGQLSAAVYGTGDTQMVARVAPNVHLQYKRWMQDFGYFFSASDDHSPMQLYDAYRYGKQTLYLREYFRLCKWLTVSWFGAINTTNDSANGRKFQENCFYFTFGPDDFKMHLGYDFERQTLRCNFEVMMDAKGTQVEYDTLEIKQDKKAKKDEPKKQEEPKTNSYIAPTQPKVLQKAVVENVKEMEDVL